MTQQETLDPLPPNSMAELLAWAKVNRPDMVPYLEQLATKRGEKAEAIWLLVASAFDAGRWYQRSFPWSQPITKHYTPGTPPNELV